MDPDMESTLQQQLLEKVCDTDAYKCVNLSKYIQTCRNVSVCVSV